MIHVEDNDLLSEVIKRSLKKDYTVITVRTLAELHSLLAEGQRVDAFLLDLNLPDSSANCTIKEIKGLSKKALVIVLSAVLTPEMVENLIGAGAYAALEKVDPHPVTSLRVTVAAAIRSHRRLGTLTSLLKLCGRTQAHVDTATEEAARL